MMFTAANVSRARSSSAVAEPPRRSADAPALSPTGRCWNTCAPRSAVRSVVTTVPSGTRVHWLPRNDLDRRPGTLALQAVRDATLPSGPYYTWTAGESALPTGLRRHLVTERGVPKSDVAFVGYWKYGHASP